MFPKAENASFVEEMMFKLMPLLFVDGDSQSTYPPVLFRLWDIDAGFVTPKTNMKPCRNGGLGRCCPRGDADILDRHEWVMVKFYLDDFYLCAPLELLGTRYLTGNMKLKLLAFLSGSISLVKYNIYICKKQSPVWWLSSKLLSFVVLSAQNYLHNNQRLVLGG